MLAGRRPVGELRHAVPLHPARGARRRPARAAGARRGRVRERRPDAGLAPCSRPRPGPRRRSSAAPEHARRATPTATFDFAADPAAGATFECSLDLGLFEPCPNPYTLTVPLGEHELLVRAKGPLGAVDLEPAGLRVDGRRRDAAGHHDPHRSAGRHQRHDGDVHLHRRRSGRVRALLARRRPADVLRVAGDVRPRPTWPSRAAPPAACTRSRSRPTSCTCSPSRCPRRGSGRSTTSPSRRRRSRMGRRRR